MAIGATHQPREWPLFGVEMQGKGLFSASVH